MEIGRYLKNIRIENFFSDKDFAWLTDLKFGDFTENNLNSDKIVHKDIDNGNKTHKVMAMYHNYPVCPNEETLNYIKAGHIKKDYELVKKVFYIVRNTLDKHFPFIKLETINLHALESIQPYTIHHDWNQQHHDNVKNKAWTIIIPFDVSKSHTIVFKQQPKYQKSKAMTDWVEIEQPPIIDKISDDDYNTYLSHTDREHCRYLEIDDIYKWEENTAFAASRYNFHCSDNFLKYGYSSKKAIVMWTSF